MDATPTADPSATATPEIHDTATSRRFESLETVLWIAGFVYQTLRHLVRYDFGYDQTIQLPTALSALRGMGLGALSPVLTDLSTTQSVKVTYWPPGWALLQLPFLAVFHDAFWAAYLSDIAGLALLFVVIRSLLNCLGDSLSSTVRFVLIFSFGFVATPYGDFWYGNLWSVAFFLTAMALVMPRGGAEAPDPAYFLSGWLLGGCVWMRYQYIAAVAAILLAILLDRRFRPGLTKIAFHLAGVGVSIIPLTLWRIFPRPKAYYIALDARTVPTSAGIHLKGLIYTVPPVGVALLGDRWRTPMLGLIPWSLPRIDKLICAGCIGWALTAVAVIGATVALRTRRVGALTRLNIRRFYAIGLSGYLLTLGLLVYLTAIHDVDITRWAYVQVGRYHAIVIVFALVGLAHAVSLISGWAGGALKILMAAIVATLFAWNVGDANAIWRQLARRDWSRPIESRFMNHRETASFLAKHVDPQRQNVLVHVGNLDNDSSLTLSVARYYGYTAASTTDPQSLDTVSPVHLVLTMRADARPELKAAFDRVCAELGPEIAIDRMVVCHGRFMPRRRGGS